MPSGLGGVSIVSYSGSGVAGGGDRSVVREACRNLFGDEGANFSDEDTNLILRS